MATEYTKSQWASLSIQERIRAMNNNMDLVETTAATTTTTTMAQQQLQEESSPHPTTTQAVDSTFATTVATQEEEEPQHRRASVVEMWRRRDNNNHRSPSVVATPIKSMNGNIQEEEEEEEKKQDDDETHRGLHSSHGSTATTTTTPSAVRNMWNQRICATTPSPGTVKRPAVGNNNSTPQDTDLTIVPSPNKSPMDEIEVPPSVAVAAAAAAAGTPTSAATATPRPANVADFWAQRGLKPITSSSSNSINNDNTNEPTAQRHEGFNHDVVSSSDPVTMDEATPLPPTAKVSVVDRWKQKVSGPEPPSNKELKSPARNAVVDRWKAAVQKPAMETAATPSPRTKVTDRWIHRQQQQPQQTTEKLSVPKRLPGVGVPPSPTSRTTASTTSSWRTADDGHAVDDEDEITTAPDSSLASPPHHPTQRLVPPASPFAATPPPPQMAIATVNQQPHVTKRWSNRLSGEPSESFDDIQPQEQHSRSNNMSSLPAPRRKGTDVKQRTLETTKLVGTRSAATTPQATPTRKESEIVSSAPSTPQSQTQTSDKKTLPRSPDSRTWLPELKHLSTRKSLASSTVLSLRPQRATPQSSPKTDNTKGYVIPRSPHTRIPDFNMFAPRSPQVKSSSQEQTGSEPSTPLTPLSAARASLAPLSPKFRYDNSGSKKSTPNAWPTLPVPISQRVESPMPRAEVAAEPRLLVLFSGQSMSRGQSSINHQISTILNGHKIPYEEMDGSILSVRDKRNELFKISGLWAVYPQFFIRDEGQTIFWGTWDTLQQCNDAGMIAEEFSQRKVGGQIASAVATTATSTPLSRTAPASRAERIQKMFSKRSSPDAVSKAEETAVEYVPPLTKIKSGEPDEDDERASIASPSRAPQSSAFDIFGSRKPDGQPDSSGKKKNLARKHKGSSIKQKIDEDAVLEGSSEIAEHSPNFVVADDSLTETTAMDESVTAQTVGESVTSASTAPRLGAKSLDSLERKDQREKKDSGNGKIPSGQGSRKKIIVSDLDAILQPTPDDCVTGQNRPKQANAWAAWPPPKNSHQSVSGRRLGAASPLSRSFSPNFSPRLKGDSAALPARTPSPAGSTTSRASAPEFSPASSTLVKRDFNSPRARRIGQRLIEKKRELQAHRQRLKKCRSGDSNDVLSTSTGNENDPAAESTTGIDNRSVDEEQRASIFELRGPPSTPILPKTPQPEAEHGPGLNASQSPEFSPSIPTKMSTTNLSKHNDSFASIGRGTPRSVKSAFSPLNDRSIHQGAALASRSAWLSPNKEAGSPTSESGLSFLDIKSDGSNSVASRGSALSLRAEKVLKQRRQKGTLAGVEEGDEISEERKHAHELARNVVYGHPKQKSVQHTADRVRKWNQLQVDTYETDQSTVQPTVPNPEYDQHSNQNLHSGALGETASMTRQRASLSSRYNTSDRFMDFDRSQRSPPPVSTKSLPNGIAGEAFAPHSTRSAPDTNPINGLYSNETNGDTTQCTSSEDFRSLSSQTSRTDSHAHTSRPSMMTGTMASVDGSAAEIQTDHGIHDDFVTESAQSYDALRSAYANVTFGQLAADFAGEMSNAINLAKIKDDVKKVLGGIRENPSYPTSPQGKPRRGFVCTDLVPYDEEDVAIEVEYFEDSMYDDEGPAYAFCEAKPCGAPGERFSFDEPKQERRRRVGEV